VEDAPSTLEGESQIMLEEHNELNENMSEEDVFLLQESNH
jgi:hypothetical protein